MIIAIYNHVQYLLHLSWMHNDWWVLDLSKEMLLPRYTVGKSYFLSYSGSTTAPIKQQAWVTVLTDAKANNFYDPTISGEWAKSASHLCHTDQTEIAAWVFVL